MTAPPLTFFVPGLPIPQGSKRAFVIKGKDGRPRPVLTESSRDLPKWRARVSLAAQEATKIAHHPGWFKKEALHLSLIFLFARPKSVRLPFPVVRPDLSKLLRAVEDSLTSVVWEDDSQVVQLQSEKQYAPKGSVARPGVYVTIVEIPDVGFSRRL